MTDFLNNFHPVVQALFATLFTWGVTALGAAAVFIKKDIKREILDLMLGMAAGVMIAASCWSLLIPSIEMSSEMGIPAWVPAASGFLLGAIFLRILDRILPHLHINFPSSEAEGIKTRWQRSTLLVLAITLHNIPEGLAVGVAFGAVASGLPSATLTGAIALALGIGIQNFPEGLAVSMPLRREGMSMFRSFWYGQLSGMVEPAAGVLGAVAVMAARPILPYALGFAAGAMIFVVVEELIPESQRGGNTDLATMGTITGFAIMMVLDVAFG
ncbi:zinc transporter ZupT [bacterium BMS3Bbin05]|nr:zinc transporter ZupT [bacterium BMS3Bbin05]HDO23536.1 ZIP family metal transporter [Nitrospirota bacterium]